MLGILGLLGIFVFGFSLDAFSGNGGDDGSDGGSSPTSGDDTLIGGDGADSLNGLAGDDLIAGAAGADTLGGGSGDDTLEGLSGDDKLEGGTGNDLIGGGLGDDVGLGGLGSDTLFGDEGSDALYGGEGSDLAFGGDGADGLFGEAGDDGLFGALGEDTMRGATGNDLLDGTFLNTDDPTALTTRDLDGSDLMFGGSGTDVLVLGSGDVAEGGADADTFMAGTWVDPGTPAVITDYDSAEDFLVLFYDPAESGAPVVTVSDDGDDAVVLMDGNAVMRVAGQAGGGVSAADIAVLDLTFRP